MHLTDKQEKVFSLLKNYIEIQKKAPSLSELQQMIQEQGMSAKSKRSVVQYLEALEKRRLISRSSEDRGIYLVQHEESENFLDIPIMGEANAGVARLFAEDNIRGFLKVSKKLLKSTQNIFALQICGDSMNRCKLDNKYIEDGDYVVVDKASQEVQNNDIILAIVEGCATIKRFKQSMFGEILLVPESANPVHQPIYIHESDSFHVNGKVINILKAAKNLA